MRSLLADELGLEPGGQLRSAQAAVLNADSVSVVAGVPDMGIRPPRPPTPLLGRESELVELGGLLNGPAHASSHDHGSRQTSASLAVDGRIVTMPPFPRRFRAIFYASVGMRLVVGRAVLAGSIRNWGHSLVPVPGVGLGVLLVASAARSILPAWWGRPNLGHHG